MAKNQQSIGVLPPPPTIDMTPIGGVGGSAVGPGRPRWSDEDMLTPARAETSFMGSIDDAMSLGDDQMAALDDIDITGSGGASPVPLTPQDRARSRQRETAAGQAEQQVIQRDAVQAAVSAQRRQLRAQEAELVARRKVLPEGLDLYRLERALQPSRWSTSLVNPTAVAERVASGGRAPSRREERRMQAMQQIQGVLDEVRQVDQALDAIPEADQQLQLQMREIMAAPVQRPEDVLALMDLQEQAQREDDARQLNKSRLSFIEQSIADRDDELKEYEKSDELLDIELNAEEAFSKPELFSPEEAAAASKRAKESALRRKAVESGLAPLEYARERLRRQVGQDLGFGEAQEVPIDPEVQDQLSELQSEFPQASEEEILQLLAQ